IRIKSKHIEEVEARYAAELEELSDQRKSLIKQSKEEAKMILSQANALIENTVRQIKEAQAEKEKTREVRKQVEDFKSQLNDEQDAAIDRKIAKLREREERKKQRKEQQDAAPAATVAKPEVKTVAVGDSVRIKGQQKAGVLIALNGNNALVQYGLMKMNVKADSLEAVSNSQIKRENRQIQSVKRSNVADRMRQKSLNFKREIDLRGMRGDEALAAVQLFIDDALMVGVSEVRILHGTGTGILRQLIRDYLATVPGVEHFHDEHVQLGGAGITVVEF
ncbi:MAG: Smr/MutS family protein, partial [Paludibacteraceae bacterium]|nr:Smr/MutS family protein [Paludibacteraceae bacterium]